MITIQQTRGRGIEEIKPELVPVRGQMILDTAERNFKVGDGETELLTLPWWLHKPPKEVDGGVVENRSGGVFGIIDTGLRTSNGATLAYIDENFNVIDDINRDHIAFKFTSETDENGNEWIRVPKVYTKRGFAPDGTEFAGKQYFLISDTMKDGFSLSPAFKDMGVEKDSFAVSAYRIAYENGNPVSKPNMTDWTKITIANAQTQCAKLGHLMDVYKWSHVAFLAAVEKKTFNPMPMADRAVREKCEYRGIHDFCYSNDKGAYMEWLDGITTDASNRLQIWDDNGNKTFTNTGLTQSRTGYIKTLQTGGVFDHVFVSDQINDDTSNCMIPDYFSFVNANSFARLSFSSSNDSSGAFYVYIYSSATYNSSNVGFRAAKY